MIISVNKENYKTIPATFYCQEIPYLDRDIQPSIAGLLDLGILERKPLEFFNENDVYWDIFIK